LKWPPPPPRPAAPPCRGCSCDGGSSSAAAPAPPLVKSLPRSSGNDLARVPSSSLQGGASTTTTRHSTVLGGASTGHKSIVIGTETTTSTTTTRSVRRESILSVGRALRRLPKMVCCCLCCPIFKCAVWFCVFEIITSFFVWYGALDFLFKTFDDLQLKDALLLVFLTAWLVTLVTSTGTLIAAERRKEPTFIWPRLIQLTGLLICGLLGALILFTYFSGGSSTINGWIISTYQSIFIEGEMSTEEKKAIQSELNLIAMCCVAVDFLYLCYFSVAMCVTWKYYKGMKREHPHFRALSQNEPTAPPPPVNPHYPVKAYA
jgi:hypothetical protein